MSEAVKPTPPIPAPRVGQRFTFSGLVGSSDAALIAQAAQQNRGNFSVMVVFCAQAQEAQRLLEEIPAFAPQLKTRLLPDWEILPYDHFSPHQDLVSERLATLYEFLNGSCDIVLVPVTTALQRMGPPSFLSGHTFFFRQGDKLNEAALKLQLQQAGYDPVSAVMRPGEYSIRGGLIDLFPMGSNLPYRLDLFGDEIEQIRSFDPDTQRSLFPVKEIRLLPGHEFPFDDISRTAARGRWREVFEGDPSRCSIYKDINLGIPSAGIESYLPIFFDQTATIFDYFPRSGDPVWLVTIGDIESSIRGFWKDTQQRYDFLKHDLDRPVLPPKELFLDVDQFFANAKDNARLVLERDPNDGQVFLPVPDVAIHRKDADPVNRLRQLVEHGQSRVLICTDSAGRKESIRQLFEESNFVVDGGTTAVFQLRPDSIETIPEFLQSPSRFGLVSSPLSGGFAWPQERIILITEAELFTSTARQRRRSKGNETADPDMLFKDLSELKIGDPVVHAEHGIGRYQGLVLLNLAPAKQEPIFEEFLHLVYANEATLYVPVQQLQLVTRYAGSDPDTAPLHQLGSGQWDKAKRKAAKQIRDTAAELLGLYAARAIRKGHAFEYSHHDYAAFAESFGFEETPDQANAITAVIGDMTSGTPMDRLVCGDVGFGKTEVALRASFIAVMGGKQVAILAPTTLLAEQHVATWKDRFADWPVRIVELSRFKSTKEINAALEAIAKGEADIIIGTHKLLSKETQFSNLGLVIVDEEHRFGVRQKDALKALRAEVDILTLTATPIPRTLGMAMEGLREFSIIATAPQKRLAIKTFVRREGDGVIREAVLREIKRGGQVYFLHNEVETIQNRKHALQELIPEARIGVAHGQMHERDLEAVMREFVTQRTNILLCTTIIETGIDVPTANTIIMHRADKFGLAQLHQLRGRVGRSHHQAYAYLMVPDPEALSKQAQLRLNAIQAMEELGSGFYLAMHDLEIRGAGEVLGDKQSGEIHEIGFQLYTEMLNRAVKSLRSGKEPDLLAPLQSITDVNLGVPALLPEDYCPDVHERLSLYKRFAGTNDFSELMGLREELVDRFGDLPDQAKSFYETHRLRLEMTGFGIKKIDASENAIQMQFIPNPPIDPLRIIQLIQNSKYIQLNGQDKLKVLPQKEGSFDRLEQRLDQIRQILKRLNEGVALANAI
ncbi:transcription-repair coupling factor [Polynucleobacter paneuropaeus]|uniref:transcription-repair coupling factor n=1 Tax=Polynucleobacter paneuropaeus TaxID=2527775 RepID=UPI000DBF0307|nr:transcription-repair coupling factor [Polynucleobacter paneuropaeus]AWW46127.1 transcription-repair coupling factor [Polynucleobacter paneuropaeus]MBT8524122.1 transcription-repair coupling factor [Polynucleobacter paneuropaeus]MBT8528203.1 transcription-repair coupling factor [Polynucleobacter paneuropaeus]MBT8564891.1 transcription-repair coupling factor [Polynucleobacter paneuropaeus]MBT8607221.1 transcription-repair coupling factor [Polynucleobacter paneuropaeus]